MSLAFGNIGTLFAAVATLMVYTYLIDHDNPVWELIQHVFMGLAFGWSIAYMYHSYIKPAIIGKQDSLASGSWWYIVPIIVGLLIYTRYFPSVAWISRYPMSIWLGYGAGQVLGNVPKTFLGQVTASFYQLWGTKSVATDINNWILLITLLGTISYFFFTIKRDTPVMAGGVWIGRWTIMVALGTAFGSTVLYRYQLFFGRLHFLLVNWLHLAP